jgi:threonine synthase
MTVSPSVAQAAMIGDPVSFPKVRALVTSDFDDRFTCIDVEEQEIIEGMLQANRCGSVVCTQGGESIAGLRKALLSGMVAPERTFVVDSTSHQLKFSNFQQMYFEDAFPADYEITPRNELVNAPVQLEASAGAVADYLGLKRK